MRLYVCIVGAEQLLDAIDRQLFSDINVSLENIETPRYLNGLYLWHAA
jgi:hypothetical protein